MKASRVGRILFAMPPLLLLSGCDVLKRGVMNHAGPIAASQWHLYVIVGIVLVFVAGPVLLLTPLIAWHYRLSNKHSAFRPNWNFSWTLEGFIWIPPIGIVIGLGVLLWNYTHALDPYRPIASSQPALEVQAVGFDWKWLFIYPDQGIATINQLSLPVGRPIHISLTSGTVMQALLIPQLAGQIYAMAGMTTQLNLAASKPGTYRGENTQFNGDGFQNEKFPVTALKSADFDNWVAGVRASSHPLDANAYAGLFRKSSPPIRSSSRRSRNICSRQSSPSLRSPDDDTGHLAGGAGPLRLERAAVCSRVGKSHRQRDHRRRRRLDRHHRSRRCHCADHAARQMALSLDRMAHQPRSQENRHHVHRAGLRDAQPRADRGGADADAAGGGDRQSRLPCARPFRATVQHAWQHHDLLHGDAVPRRPHQLCHAPPDRQPRRRLPAAELDQPVADRAAPPG